MNKIEKDVDEFLRTHSFHKTTGWIKDTQTPIIGKWTKPYH